MAGNLSAWKRRRRAGSTTDHACDFSLFLRLIQIRLRQIRAALGAQKGLSRLLSVWRKRRIPRYFHRCWKRTCWWCSRGSYILNSWSNYSYFRMSLSWHSPLCECQSRNLECRRNSTMSPRFCFGWMISWEKRSQDEIQTKIWTRKHWEPSETKSGNDLKVRFLFQAPINSKF